MFGYLVNIFLIPPILSLSTWGAHMVGPRSRLSLLFVLLFLICVSSSPSAANVLEGTVVKIADGDTITVLDAPA